MKNDVGCICGTTAFPAFHYPPCKALPQGALTPPDSDAREVCVSESLRYIDRQLEAIQIRCREGAKDFDWKPTIDNLATDARSAVKVVVGGTFVGNDLAQRILAALAFDVSHEALASELRAVIGK